MAPTKMCITFVRVAYQDMLLWFVVLQEVPSRKEMLWIWVPRWTEFHRWIFRKCTHE